MKVLQPKDFRTFHSQPMNHQSPQPALPRSIAPRISDESALASAMSNSPGVPIPLTFNPYSLVRRRITYPAALESYPQTIMSFAHAPARRLPAGPLIVGSLGMLNGFGAFADDTADPEAAPADQTYDPSADTSTSDTSGIVSSPAPVTSTDIPARTVAPSPAATGPTFSNQLMTSLPSLLSSGVNLAGIITGAPPRATATPNQPASVSRPAPASSGISTTTLLLLAAGLGATLYFMSKKKGRR